MIAGKIIGGYLGLVAGGLVGAIVGLIVGHLFDKSLAKNLNIGYGSDRAQQQLFFETAFSIMGHLAKSDGRISQPEIAQAEALMARYGLTSEQRQQAIRYFKQGAQPGFQLEETLTRFVQQMGRRRNLSILLLEFLITVALADGDLHLAERRILGMTARYLGFSEKQFQHLLTMFTAQRDFSQRHQYRRQQYQERAYQAEQPPPQQQLQQAYQALGVNSSVSDRDLKRAYRKLMSEHHPDKLMARGVPEEMVKMATEKAQHIQAAYELIRKSRD